MSLIEWLFGKKKPEPEPEHIRRAHNEVARANAALREVRRVERIAQGRPNEH